jgi:hypothetical protein
MRVQTEIAHIRRTCLGLPDVSERLSHGQRTWFVQGKRAFVALTWHKGERLAFWCASDADEQHALIASDPQRFFRPSGARKRNWVGMFVDDDVTPVEVEEMLDHAYRRVAPKKLVGQLDESRSRKAG